MAKVTIQYWAAAKAAAGVDVESVEAETLAEALEVIVARRGDDGRLRAVGARFFFLGRRRGGGPPRCRRPGPSGHGRHRGATPVRRGVRGESRRGGHSAYIAAHWGDN